jgi:hypothetical protein
MNGKKYIHVRSPKFAILPGEKEELVNDGTYGKGLAEYLQGKLREKGYVTPLVCCEDWGWWIELKAPFAFGVCIYCDPDSKDILDLFCTDGATSDKKWSWAKLRFIDTTPWVKKLHEDLVSIFQADKEVELVSTCLDEPFTQRPDDKFSQPNQRSNP